MTDFAIGAGEVDLTLELCNGGIIEISLSEGDTDESTALYGELDVESAEALIDALQELVHRARRNAA
jgi:hypothetical protein